MNHWWRRTGRNENYRPLLTRCFRNMSKQLPGNLNISLFPSLSCRMTKRSLLQRTWPLPPRMWLRWTLTPGWGFRVWGTAVWTRAWLCRAEEPPNTSTCSTRSPTRGAGCLETLREARGGAAWPDRWDFCCLKLYFIERSSYSKCWWWPLTCRRSGWERWRMTMKMFTTETLCPDTTRCWEERSPETACTAGRLRSSTPRKEVTDSGEFVGFINM